jgi:hypothetical protein
LRGPDRKALAKSTKRDIEKLSGNSKYVPPSVAPSIGGVVLGGYRFTSCNPFDRSGFADPHAAADFERSRRFPPFDELIKEAAADVVGSAKIVDALGIHGVAPFDTKNPRRDQSRSRQGFGSAIMMRLTREHYVNEQRCIALAQDTRPILADCRRGVGV